MDLLSIIAPAITNLAFFPCMYLVARYALYVQRKTYSEREAELQAQLADQKVNAQKLLQMIVSHAEVIEQLRRDLSMLRTRQEFHERAFHAPQLTPPPNNTPNKAAPAEPQEEVAGSWFLPLGVTTSTTPFNAEPAAQVVQPEPGDARWAMIEMD